MMPFLSLLSSLALVSLGDAPGVDRLFVAGAAGVIHEADPREGVFVPFATVVGGTILDLDHDRRRLYASDDLGNVHILRLADGALERTLPLGLGPIAAITAAKDSLFVGLADARVLRFDPATGHLLGLRTVPSGVQQMVANETHIFVNTVDGGIFRASFELATFEYFTCFCLFDIQDMVFNGGRIQLVDPWGNALSVSPSTGAMLDFFNVGTTNSMAVLEGDLLFYYAGGGITRVDAHDGLPAGNGFASPSGVETMLVVSDRARRGHL